MFQALLFVLFFNFFGLESLKRYWKYEVVVLDSEKRLDGLPVPAVTVCPQNPITGIGFKTNITASEALQLVNGTVLHIICENIELKKCIEDEAFNLSMVITSVSSTFHTFLQSADQAQLFQGS